MLTWPNAESFANSDPWLVAHHDELRLMRPRVLVVNYVNGLRDPRPLLDRLCAALRESSRWQGYRDPTAPPFLDAVPTLSAEAAPAVKQLLDDVVLI